MEKNCLHSFEDMVAEEDNVPLVKKKRYTRRQWTVFGIFCCINLGSGMCYTILAPFYPAEAEMRGVSSSVYGFIFGVFELVDFIVCPLYGKYIRVIGPRFMLNAGNFVLAICTLLFGLVDKMPTKSSFVFFSFLIRVVEALGQAGCLTASYAIIAEEFSDNIATTFSVLETMFAFGMIVGPSAGGFLLEIGGFVFPFMVVGIVLLIASIAACCILPSIELPEHKSNSLIKFVCIPSITISYYAVVVCAFSLTFIFALLEPFLRQFHLTPAEVGLILVINGGTYAITAPIWGFLSDKYFHPKLLVGFNAIVVMIAFTLLGPAPFIPIDPVLWLTLLALVIHGAGAAGEYVPGFLDSIREAIANGYPENIETYAMVAGLWTSGNALGSFIGPSISGILNDKIGFRSASVLVIILHGILVVLCFGYYWVIKRTKKKKEETYFEMPHLNGAAKCSLEDGQLK